MIKFALKILVFITIFLFFLFLLPQKILAQENYFCAVYFTGVGCPHCAKTDPLVLENLLKEHPNLIIIEYEIYQTAENAPLLYQYADQYQFRLGIPLIILNKEEKFLGDRQILKNIEKVIKEKEENKCPLVNGQLIDFYDLDLNSLPGSAKIWREERILIKGAEQGDNELLKKLLTTENLDEILKEQEFKETTPFKIALSGKSLFFKKAIVVKDWLFQWGKLETPIPSLDKKGPPLDITQIDLKLTLAKVFSLAVVDAINPCAFAVLILMLITILTYNPEKRKNILLAGLYFVLSVFLMYLIYGLIIIKSFELIQTITSVRLALYKILGGLAILIGILNIKDFLRYKPGGFLTEMPLFLRPKVKKIILGITSPKGAFLIGAFVTIFLLPCTIGPYIICGGILCPLGIIRALPYLLFYNLIFILPMLIIVLMIYFGISKIENISSWKDKNIKYLHLTAGIIILALGFLMAFGLI